MPLLNLLVALGVGLLIGTGRERAINDPKGPADAGVRTFSLAALGGAVAITCGGVMLLAVLAVAIAALAGLSYWRNREQEGPGLTTEFALLLTVLSGGLAMKAPSAAGAVGIVAALLLSSRERLHHFVRTVLTEDEVRSALILGAALIVVMPLLPDRQMGPYEALNPQSVWRLVVLVLLIGAIGHLATRVLGPRFGLSISGLASGFVSSSATIGAMGARAAKDPKVMSSAVAGAVLSTVATVVQMALVVGATSPAALQVMAAPLICAGLAAAGYGAVFTIAALRTPPPKEGGRPDSAFSLIGALIFALTLSVVLLASAALRAEFGATGAILAAAVAGFVDTHAPAISIASLTANGRISAQDAVIPILAGFTTNTITKIVVASTSGGRAFALRVAPGVVLVAAAAWAGALIGHVVN
ncbi:MgtC/SapB family protein [Caulobacter sp.]|uniref:MgtC/SapB family protein n=1 Tax=Caulobacter sp. TaxID=78 RepID=UPI003BAE2D80